MYTGKESFVKFLEGQSTKQTFRTSKSSPSSPSSVFGDFGQIIAFTEMFFLHKKGSNSYFL